MPGLSALTAGCDASSHHPDAEAFRICSSHGSFTQLPWGRNGRSPDQRMPRRQPTELMFGDGRLTGQCGVFPALSAGRP